MKAKLQPMNYTPHDIVVRIGVGREITYRAVGVCRAESSERCAFSWDPETETEWHVHAWGQSDNPRMVVMVPAVYERCSWTPGPPADGADVIVSVVAAPAVVEARPDLRVFIPDTGPASAIRDSKGKIEAIRRLILWRDPLAKTHLLRVVRPANPANIGDGYTLFSRHLPTREGVVEAMSEDAYDTVDQDLYLELVDEHGNARQSAYIRLTNDVNLMWAMLQEEIDRPLDSR